uniref:Uncharacterized protein n=1 Tax=Arundo donax TaxID=35708 RepID=A0A0A8YLA3_ARUDO
MITAVVGGDSEAAAAAGWWCVGRRPGQEALGDRQEVEERTSIYENSDERS